MPEATKLEKPIVVEDSPRVPSKPGANDVEIYRTAVATEGHVIEIFSAPESQEINFRTKPIIRKILPHTKRLDGNDTGYREVECSDLDNENPDPLVILSQEQCYCVYYHGKKSKITPYYGEGIGADEKILVRAPVARALKKADEFLKPYNKKLLVLDGWRSAKTQAAMWAEIRKNILKQQNQELWNLSVSDEIKVGREADKVGSYCKIIKDNKYAKVFSQLQRSNFWKEVEDAAQELHTPSAKIAEEYLIYQGNLGKIDLTLDEAAPTSHGSGGAVDVWLTDEQGEPLNLGVPFDYAGEAAVMDFFEWANWKDYKNLVSNDKILRDYLADYGIKEITPEIFEEIKTNRRILFHAMISAGATYYSLGRKEGEPWHFNFGNELGGKQADTLPGAGSSCHSLLKNIRDQKTGQWTAIWSNKVAHALAKQILGPSKTLH